MPVTPILGRPGFGTATTISNGRVFRADEGKMYFPHGGSIDGTKSRYYGGGTNLFHLPPGLLMGQVTATKKWAPSILGVNQSAYTSGGTSVTVTAAQATEIVRRVGATGTLLYVGPPSAAGTVASISKAYSAINTTTGVITTADLAANFVAGGFIMVADGTEVPRTVIDDGFGVSIPSDGSDCDFPRIPTGGHLDVSKIIDYPTDTSLIAWLKDKMAANGRGLWTFSDEYSAA